MKYKSVLYKFLFLFSIMLLMGYSVFCKNIWNDQQALTKIEHGLDYAYNFEFAKAEGILKDIKADYGDHAATLLLEASILRWKHYPIVIETEIGEEYENILLKSLDCSEKEEDATNLMRFFSMMPRLMLVQFYADNGESLKAVPYLKNVYRSIVQGFDYCKTTPEFYFTTGLYNYYIDAYPEANSFYKPIVFFFPDGDKERGLEELYKCFNESAFCGAEAMSFLTYIHINFERDYVKGVKLAEELANKYPNNPLFATYHVQLLLLNKQYDKARLITQTFNLSDKSQFFKNIVNLYNGIIIEQTDFKVAENKYKDSINAMRPFGTFAKRYKSYAYFGLSRISYTQGLDNQGKIYRSQAEKMAQYPHVNFE